VALHLDVRVEQVEGATELLDGWRGLLDFGEHWTEADAALWPGPGSVPLGKPLVYGCELQWRGTQGTTNEALLTLWSVDAPRSVMRTGAPFRLLDGSDLRATGELRAAGT
jgi:hypothetical protein